MLLPVVLLLTGVLTGALGAMYFYLQNNSKPSLSFYTSPGVAQVLAAILLGTWNLHWAAGLIVFVLLTYLFICALKWGELV